MGIKYTDEEIITKYKELSDRLGSTPTQNDINNESKITNNFPNCRTIFRRFGGQNELNKICGLQDNYIIYTDEELLNKLKCFYDNYGFPTKKKITNDKNMPNAEVYRIRFGSFKDAILKANIPIPKNKQNSLKNNKVYISDEELLKQLKQVLDTYGIIPISKFKECGLHSMVVYRNRFGTYKDILNMLDIPITEDIKNKYFSKFKNKSNEELLVYLKDYYNKYGLPTIRDLKNNTDYPSDYIYRKRFGSFENALKAINIEIPENKKWLYNRESIDTETILNNFKNFIESNYTEKDFLPGMKELFILCDIPSQSVLFKRFGTIKYLYNLIGIDFYKHNNCALELDMTDKYLKLNDKLGYVADSRDIDKASKEGICYGMKTYSEHFGSLIEFQKSLNLTPTASIGLMKSDEELLTDLKELGLQIGRLPTQKDVDECDWMASSTLYVNRFNNYHSALLLAGFNENWSNRRTIITPNGNIALSSYEYDFLIMLENYNINFIKEEYYKKYIDGLNRRFQFDFTIFINNNIYFIEIFGIMSYEWYREKAKLKIQICEDNNLPLIDLYKEDFKKSDTETLYNLLIDKINNINIHKDV